MRAMRKVWKVQKGNPDIEPKFIQLIFDIVMCDSKSYQRLKAFNAVMADPFAKARAERKAYEQALNENPELDPDSRAFQFKVVEKLFQEASRLPEDDRGPKTIQ